MLVRQVYQCLGCASEGMIERYADGSFPHGSLPNGWNRLGFKGGQLSVELCGQCVDRVLDACPKLRETMGSHLPAVHVK